MTPTQLRTALARRNLGQDEAVDLATQARAAIVARGGTPPPVTDDPLSDLEGLARELERPAPSPKGAGSEIQIRTFAPDSLLTGRPVRLEAPGRPLAPLLEQAEDTDLIREYERIRHEPAALSRFLERHGRELTDLLKRGEDSGTMILSGTE